MNANTGSDSRTDPKLTRRRAITGGACLLGISGGALHLLTGDVKAQVSMGELVVGGTEATLSQPPAKIPVRVTGEWQVNGGTPAQCRTVLQIHTPGGQADDLDEQIFFERASGAYELSTELFAHDEISRGDLLPETADESASYDFLVRVILLVVNGGEITSEVFVEDQATLTLTNGGLELSVSGSGNLSVEKA